MRMSKWETDGRRIIFVGATIYPKRLPERVMSRLQTKVYVPLPQTVDEYKIFLGSMLEVSPDFKLNNEELNRLATKALCKRLSGRDLLAACRGATRMAIKRRDEKLAFEYYDLLDEAIDNMVGISKEELNKYAAWEQEFGGQAQPKESRWFPWFG